MTAALVALLCAGPPARAAETCHLTPGREARVARVLDGRTIELAEAGTVRLAGVLPPVMPAWWKGDPARTDEARAVAALESLVAGRRVRLAVSERERDRRNRLLAQAFVRAGPETVWVQGRLVEEGHARVASHPGSAACVRALQAREARARAAGAGLWAGGFFAVVSAAETQKLLRRRYTFQIVEGRVADVGVTRNWTFLNFAEDYRTDFTVAIRAGDRPAFRDSEVPPESLEGARLRVRGWIERWNGPVIKATHPEQIERLAGPEPAQRPAQGGAQKRNPAAGEAPGSRERPAQEPSGS